MRLERLIRAKSRRIFVHYLLTHAIWLELGSKNLLDSVIRLW